MNVLVTAGATREPIDAVRFISNLSTGRTGAALADGLSRRGHLVTLLHGCGAATPDLVRDLERFGSAEDLSSRLHARLAAGEYDAVVMAAAVADYRPVHCDPRKLSSASENRTLELRRNPKILPQLKLFSRRPLSVIGFKLTMGADAGQRRAAAAAQFAAGGVDAVVHNDLAEIRREAVHLFWLFAGTAGEGPQRCEGTEQLAAALELLCERKQG